MPSGEARTGRPGTAQPGKGRPGTGRPGKGRPKAGRLSADDRRKQLVGIGLRLLVTKPIHQLSIDEVAHAAGISRSLLFHYFPTKRDYYVAVVRAAARRLLKATTPAADASTGEQLHQILDGFVQFVDRRRDPYVALVRGAAGGDDWVLAIYDETRDALSDRVLKAMGNTDRTALVEQATHAWLAFVEDLAIEWSRNKTVERNVIVKLMLDALGQVVGQAARPLAEESRP